MYCISISHVKKNMALPSMLPLPQPSSSSSSSSSSSRFCSCFSPRPKPPPLQGFIIRVSPLSTKPINGISNPRRLRFKTAHNSHSNQHSVSAALVEGDLDLGRDGEVFKKTLRLVECAMLASVAGLTYVLSNTLAIENYFGCFFCLPIVISSMRWGLGAGRKTMVATAMLLLTLSGPVKASTYLLMHGFLGLAMGSLWRLGMNWGVSILLCTLVRMLGAVGFVLLSSFLIRENILYLIAINIHASIMNTFGALGINAVISMGAIYTIFGCILMLNCAFLVLLLHVLYAILLTKLGMKASVTLPSWLERYSGGLVQEDWLN